MIEGDAVTVNVDDDVTEGVADTEAERVHVEVELCVRVCVTVLVVVIDDEEDAVLVWEGAIELEGEVDGEGCADGEGRGSIKSDVGGVSIFTKPAPVPS